MEDFQQSLELKKNQPIAMLYKGLTFFHRGMLKVCSRHSEFFICLKTLWSLHFLTQTYIYGHQLVARRSDPAHQNIKCGPRQIIMCFLFYFIRVSGPQDTFYFILYLVIPVTCHMFPASVSCELCAAVTVLTLDLFSSGSHRDVQRSSEVKGRLHRCLQESGSGLQVRTGRLSCSPLIFGINTI